MLIIIHSTNISLSAKIIRSKLTATQTIVSLPLEETFRLNNDWSREHSPALNTKETRKPRRASIREKNRGGVHFQGAISSRAPSRKDEDTRWRMTIHSAVFRKSSTCNLCGNKARVAITRLIVTNISRDLQINRFARCSRTQTSLPVHEED